MFILSREVNHERGQRGEFGGLYRLLSRRDGDVQPFTFDTGGYNHTFKGHENAVETGMNKKY